MSYLSTRRRILVGTVTRNRPAMLSMLLASYRMMEIPENCTVDFLIVENNTEMTLNELLDNFRSRVNDGKVFYLLEPKLGIACARNRVLQFAIDCNYDLLTFADDDETVAPDWLRELLTERDAHDLDLVGSPVRIARAPSNSTWWQKMVWSAINDHNKRSENRSRDIWKRGQADRLRIATGSWLANVHFLRRVGLRFDANLGLAGGEDWRLYHRAKKLGAKTGWSPSAFAYETLPLTRLSLLYYYRRNRDHVCTTSRERFEKNRFGGIVALSGSILARTWKIIVAVVLFPLAPRKFLLDLTYSIGSIAGLLRAIGNKESAHYAQTHGN